MSDLTKGPGFPYYPRSVPWTHRNGNQNDYRIAVKSWKSFYNKFPNSDSNKISVSLGGMVLLTNLYRRAKDLVKCIPFSQIKSAEVVEKACEAQ